MLNVVRPVSGIGFLLLVASCFSYIPTVMAIVPEDEPEVYSLFESVIQKCHNEEFEQALTISNTIREKFPEEPAGAFGLIITYQSVMQNYRIRTYEKELNEQLEISIELSKKAIKKDRKNGRSYFYLGCAYGSKSIDNARLGKWLEALRNGTQVMGNFKKAIAYSPEFYDAYYGLGLFNYWLSAKSRVIRAFSDTRREGIEQMRIAVDKGRFLKTSAMYGLLAAYTNEKNYDLAFELADRLYVKYSKNPNLLYRRGNLHVIRNNWQAAHKAFGELYDVLVNAPYQSLSFQAECLFHLAKCEYNLGNMLETKRLCLKAVELTEICEFEKELDGPLISYEEIKEQLYELTAEVKDIQLTESPPTGSPKILD